MPLWVGCLHNAARRAAFQYLFFFHQLLQPGKDGDSAGKGVHRPEDHSIDEWDNVQEAEDREG